MSERWSNITVVESTTVTTLLIWSGWSDIPPIWSLASYRCDQNSKRGNTGR